MPPTLITQTFLIGDKDGFGVGVPVGGDHPFDGFAANEDHRSGAEIAATDGAEFTDTYSTTHPGYSPHGGLTVATFTFSELGVGLGWTGAVLEINAADFQASAGGEVVVTCNGLKDAVDLSDPLSIFHWDDGFPHTAVHVLDIGVLDWLTYDSDLGLWVDYPAGLMSTINATGQLVIVINRNTSDDFYGFDYLQLTLSRPTTQRYIRRWLRRTPSYSSEGR